MRKLLLLTILLKFNFFLLQAQPKETDYLARLQQQAQAKDLPMQYQANVGLTRYWNFRDDKQALSFAQNALNLAQQAQNKYWQSSAKILIAVQYEGLHDYAKAEEILWQVCKDFPNERDTLYVEARYHLAEIADIKDDTPTKIPYGEYAYQCAKKSGHNGLIAQTAGLLSFFHIYNNAQRVRAIELQHETEKYIALCKPEEIYYKIRALSFLEIVAMEIPDFQVAKGYCEQLITLCDRVYNIRFACFGRTGLGYICNNANKFEEAIPYFEQNIKMLQSIGKKGDLGTNLDYLAVTLQKMDNVKKAIPYFFESLKIAKNEGFKDHISNVSCNLAEALVKIGRNKEAEIYYKESLAIAESLKMTSYQKTAFDLSQLLEKQGRTQEALYYYKRATVAKDSILNLDNERKIKELDLKKQAETYELKVQNEQGKVAQQRNLVYALLSGILAMVVGVFLWFRNRQKRVLLLQERNAALAIAKTKAEESERFKQQFLANMSHEIRTPLNAITGVSQLLARQNFHEEKSRNYISILKKSSDNLLLLLNNVLDFSKIQINKLAVENTIFDLPEVLDFLKKSFEPLIVEKGLILQLFQDEKIPKFVKGDVVRLTQVLNNLLSNALKFTSKGIIEIRVTTTTNNRLLFEVKDTGIGIAEDKLVTIFESFTQANNSDARFYGGTGLGLTIAKDLVRLMSGELKVKSELGKGSIFYFELPLIFIENIEIADNQLFKKLNWKRNIQILLAEDNEHNQIIAKDSLALISPQIEVTIAQNGKEALAMFANTNKKFDLLLLDIQMPEMNGFEVAKALRSEGINLPIIAMTASVLEGDIQLCYDAGMNDYISKPFNINDLTQKIISKIPIELIKNEEVNSKKTSKADRFTQLKAIFETSLPQKIHQIETAIANDNPTLLLQTFHALRPQIDYFSKDKALVRDMESIEKKLENADNLKLQIADIQKITNRILEI